MTQFLPRQRGFTLIELVMVIVILGLLAAAALPRFSDLRQQAQVASFDGVKAGFKTGIAIAHAKSIAQGKDASGFRDVLLDGTCINIDPVSGFPTVNQTPGSCAATAFLKNDGLDWLRRLAQGGNRGHWFSVLGVSRAVAMMPPPPTLPELLIQLDITGWTWAESPPTGTLTAPGGQSFVYNQNNGSVL